MLQLSVNMREVRYVTAKCKHESVPITAKCKHERGPVYYS